MHIKEISYKRLQSLGNWNNAEIGVTIEIKENESVDEAMNIARNFVEGQLIIVESALRNKENETYKNLAEW